MSVVTDMQFEGNSLAAQVDAERLSATVSRHQHGDQQVGGVRLSWVDWAAQWLDRARSSCCAPGCSKCRLS